MTSLLDNAEKKMEVMMTRDVGTQSTPPDISSSSSPSPSSTPPIKERSLNRCENEAGDSPKSNTKLKSEEQQVCVIICRQFICPNYTSFEISI